MMASAPCGPMLDLLTEIGPPADLSVEMLENLSQPAVIGTLNENVTPSSVTACRATTGSPLEATPGWDGGPPSGRDCRSASSPDVTSMTAGTTTSATTTTTAPATAAARARASRRSSGVSPDIGGTPIPCAQHGRCDSLVGLCRRRTSN